MSCNWSYIYILLNPINMTWGGMVTKGRMVMKGD